jgi:hypothetical protein
MPTALSATQQLNLALEALQENPLGSRTSVEPLQREPNSPGLQNPTTEQVGQGLDRSMSFSEHCAYQDRWQVPSVTPPLLLGREPKEGGFQDENSALYRTFFPQLSSNCFLLFLSLLKIRFCLNRSHH